MVTLSGIKQRLHALHAPPPADGKYDAGTYETLARMRDWRRDDVIVDVGANDGRTILRWRRHLPHTRVIAFEPVGATFAELTERTAGLADVTRHKCALGASPGSQTIYLDPISALNSFYADRVSGDAHEEVPVETLDRVLAREGVERVHLLKIDAEGHDLEVLKGATGLLGAGRIDIIEVEAGFAVPGYPMPSLSDFTQYLMPFGYYPYAITNQCRARLGKFLPAAADGANPEVLVYCDALFVRGTPAP